MVFSTLEVVDFEESEGASAVEGVGEVVVGTGETEVRLGEFFREMSREPTDPDLREGDRLERLGEDEILPLLDK
jgi:hypothetical protein